MSTAPGLSLWVQDREEVLKQDDGVEWRDGNRPDYSRTNAFLEKERKHNHAELFELQCKRLAWYK